MIAKHDRSLTIRDYKLAGAMASMGILPDPRGFEERFRHDGRDYYCWHFLHASKDGVYKAAELIRAWRDPEGFNKKFPEHPFSFVMIAFKNADGLRERCNKQAPKFIIERGKSVAVVDPEGSPEVAEHLLMKLGI